MSLLWQAQYFKKWIRISAEEPHKSPVFLNLASITFRLSAWVQKALEFESLESERDHLRWRESGMVHLHSTLVVSLDPGTFLFTISNTPRANLRALMGL